MLLSNQSFELNYVPSPRQSSIDFMLLYLGNASTLTHSYCLTIKSIISLYPSPSPPLPCALHPPHLYPPPFTLPTSTLHPSPSTLLPPHLYHPPSTLPLLSLPSVLLSSANLTLSYGRRYGLLGRNGVGKTTLLKTIARRELHLSSYLSILHVEQVCLAYIRVCSPTATIVPSPFLPLSISTLPPPLLHSFLSLPSSLFLLLSSPLPLPSLITDDS